jgi:uncharacterized membrane protein
VSEFLECQKCGRRYFADRMDCPYCEREAEVAAAAPHDIVTPLRPARAGSGMHGILFGSFQLLLIGIVLFSAVQVPRMRLPSTRLFLALQAAVALVTVIGMLQRRRWGRAFAILFIVANVGLGVLALVRRGEAGGLAWGPGPIALLLFLIPLLSPQARARYSR